MTKLLKKTIGYKKRVTTERSRPGHWDLDQKKANYMQSIENDEFRVHKIETKPGQSHVVWHAFIQNKFIHNCTLQEKGHLGKNLPLPTL